MANTNPLVAEISDKNGQVYDIAAKRFSGTRTVALEGDVSASESGWNGSSALTLSTQIGQKKVKTGNIDDKAVGTGQIDDEAVGLAQMDPAAMNGTVQDNDSKLATHAAVKTYVDAQISGQGTYLGKHTVAEINSMVTDNLHNGDRVMVSDSGTINLGPGGQGFDVVAGEDLILYKSGSTVQWDSMDGNFKTKQTAVSKSGTSLKTVTAITQNANGEVDATFSDIQEASTSQAGVVQLNDATNSTSTSQAATANAVKKAYDHVGTSIAALDAEKTSADGTNVQVKVTEVDGKVTAVNITTDNTENKNNKVTSWSSTTTDTHYPSEKLVKDSLDDKADKVSSATSGNYAGLDANGNLTDSGSKAADFATAAQGSKADSAVQGVKLDGASSALTPDANKVVTIPNAAPTGTGATNGLMTAADKAKLNGITSGANKVEASNTNGNIKIDGTETNVYTHPSAGPSSATSVGDTTNQTPAFGGTFKAISQTVNTDGHTTATAEHTVTLPTDGKDLTSTVATVDNYTNPGSTATALKTLFGKIWNFIGRLRTSWQTTPDDTHFPSEKLVKDSLDLKAPLASPALSGTPTAPTAAAGTNTTQIATTAFVQSAVDAQKLFYNPGNTTYGYMKLGTVHVPSTKKGAFEIQVAACYNVGGAIAQIDATFSINAGTITTKSFAKGLLRYKLAYKANSESTTDNLIYDIWLIDTTSGDSATRRASYVLLPTNIESWVNGNQSTQTLPDGLTYFTTLNDVSANGAVGSASIPTYVGSDGEIKACTDDFVHDADVAGFVTGPSSATADDIVVFDGATGKIVKDGGKKISDLKTKQTAVSDPTASGTALSFIDSITQNANGEITPTKKSVTVDSTYSASGTNPVNGTAVAAAIDLNRGFAYRGGPSATSAGVQKVAEISMRPHTSSHIEEYVFSCSFSRSSDYYATSNLVLFVNINKTGPTATISLKNNYLYSSKTSVDWKFYAHTDLSTDKLTLYAVWQQSYYTTCDIKLDFANSESLDLRNYVTMFSRTDATLPEDAVVEETGRYLNTDTNGTAVGSQSVPVYINPNGTVRACTVDSAPTANSTNLVTSGGVKTAIDAVSANVYPWYRTGYGGGTAQWMKVCDILLPELTNYSGYIYKFDYLMEYNTTIATSKSGSFELQVRTRGANYPEYLIYVRKDTGPKSSQVYPSLKLYKKVDGGKQYLTIAVSAGGTTYNGIATRIHGCVNQGGYLINGHVTMATNTVYTVPSDYTEVTNVVTDIVPVYSYGTAVGSTSVPVYVDANGEIKACTDDFARDSEVVTNVKQVTESNALKLKFTKNGSDTTFLEFMTSAETTSMIAAAKAAAS